MKQRIVLAVVSVLLVSFSAHGSDLPDLEAVVARNKAHLESIRSGRITYIAEATLGASDFAEFKKYYRKERETYLEKLKAAGAEQRTIDRWQRELDDFDNAAARQLVNGTVRQRIVCVFDMDQEAIKEDHTDLRDVPAMMSRYGVEGEVRWHDQSMSTHVSGDAHKTLKRDPQILSISSDPSGKLFVKPLSFSGWMERVPKPASQGGVEDVESVDIRRDPENPQRIIIEGVRRSETEETFHFFENGKMTTVKLPLEEPTVRKTTIVLDEARDFRVTSMTVFENGLLRVEVAYEYSSDDPLSLASVVKSAAYRPDGSVERTSTYRIESAELNVPIDPSDLELKIPPGTRIFDHRGPKPVIIPTDAAEEAVEEVTAAAETPTPPAEVEEAPEIEPPSPPEIPAAEGEPPQTGPRWGLWIVAGVIAVALIVVLALVLRRGRIGG